MSALLDLAARCEAATGPDRELDAAIAVAALGFYIAEPRYEGAPVAYGYIDGDGSRVEPGHGGMQLIRDFTASMDAALTLAPEGFLVTVVNARDDHGKRVFDAGMALVCSADTIADAEAVYAATMPLALCSAALRARAASGTLTEGGDVQQAPSDSLSGPTGNAGDAQ